ncbi:MFS multidrug transporter like protein [Zymoseptoria brevis]|uniref:MFS multidrug transporter like protein n=1 Tax=Zymoseptoria brevis TaxID=1047168 RepID=A0A0F4GVW2_9PEZI|nr:MFS multidrug transporter like protein [Zymoseptoria brevis]
MNVTSVTGDRRISLHHPSCRHSDLTDLFCTLHPHRHRNKSTLTVRPTERKMPANDHERSPLLRGNGNGNPRVNHDRRNHPGGEQKVEFGDDDYADPKQWPISWKWIQTVQVFLVAFFLPMSSSMFAPAIERLAGDFGTDKQTVLYGQMGFVCMLGIGPLFHAPMGETFGRRPIYLTNLAIFTLLQLASALSPNIASFIAFRTLSGFFGSVGVANGGGTISDMFNSKGRAQVLGFYFMGPLLGPCIGPLLGGLLVGSLHWRWVFWLSMLFAGLTTIICFFFLYETRAQSILEMRKSHLSKKHPDMSYTVEGTSDKSIFSKMASNSTRAIKILTTQPIVLTMSIYQALVFSSMYTLYSQYTTIWSSAPYEFTKSQIGLAYLGPALGFVFTSIFIILFIDRLDNWLVERHNDDAQPEYRLPMANVGAIFLPVSLFWFGWTVDKGLPWPVPLAATLLFGGAQVSIFNTVQTYYIDAYESNAASALAAGAFLRSILGGVVPLFASAMFEKLGYGLGMSVFGVLSLILMPAPLLFYKYGKTLREKYPFKG